MSSIHGEKTERLIEQMEARVSEMTPDERDAMRAAIDLWGKLPEQVGELRKFAAFLFTRLNARAKVNRQRVAA